MKKLFALFLTTTAGLALTSRVQAQCNISATANPIAVCVGDSSQVFANAFIPGSNYNFDFNSSTIPAGWSTGGSTFFNSPCLPSLDGSPYYWAATAVGTPFIETVDLNCTAGGTINFEFVYAVQGGPTPCEGPDEQDEGISVQYSTDAGLTWNDIIYYSPGGFSLPANPGGNTSIAAGPTAYTVWNTVTIPIPLAAQTTATRFRWIQFNSSGGCCDNWGLDNINISSGVALNYNWSTGLSGWNQNQSTLYNLQSDTCIIITALDTVSGQTCTDTVCIQVYPLPVPNLTYTNPICAGQQITFDGTGTTPVGGIATYEFDLDNNGTYEYNFTNGVQNFTYFVIAGNYTVGFQVTTPGGCSAQGDFPVQVYNNPTLNVSSSPLELCLGDTFDLQAVGGIINPPSLPSTLDQYDWDMDNNGSIEIVDNAGGTNSTQNFMYGTPGSYTVMVTVTTSGGCTAQDSVDVIVHDHPTAAFASTNVCFNFQTDVNDASQIIAPDVITGYDWTITNTSGYSFTSSNQNIQQTFPDTGTYTATLVITSDKGCVDSVEQTFLVYPQPTADFSYTTGCFAHNTFISTSSGGADTLFLEWDLTQDAQTDTTDFAFEYVFSDSSDQNVTLTVTDTNGCTSSITQLVDVKGGVNEPQMPDVMNLSSSVGNDKYDFQQFAPGFNDCINYTLAIYNRWGILVYEAVNDTDAPDLSCSNCFTGRTATGSTVTPGTYYYILRGQGDPSTPPIEKNGTITIFD